MGSEWKRVNISKLCDIERGCSPRPIHDFIRRSGVPCGEQGDACILSACDTEAASFARPVNAVRLDGVITNALPPTRF